MHFTDIEKNSLNDYPGKISFVIFTSGCNFYCPYCHNPQTTFKKYSKNFNFKKILQYIKKNKKFYDGIVITGGEPTINKKIIYICKKLKKIGLPIKLDTNGSKPNILKLLLNKKIIDYVAMDIKTSLSFDKYKFFTNESNIIKKIKKSIKLLRNNGNNYEFRTTCVNPFINIKIIKEICNEIKNAKKYTLQRYNIRAKSILNPNFYKNKNPEIEQNKLLNYLKICKKFIKNTSLIT